ncbi:hypothetical protein ACVGOW_00505 [Pseudonocardia saturnea]
MSTFIDGAPPSVTPGPDDGDPRDDTGSSWLQEEIRRRMAERSSGSGGRHARRDPAGDPPGGVEHVPRHSVATPGPGAPPPGPIGGPSLPPTGAPVRRRHDPEPDDGWSGPGEEVDPPARPGRRVPQAFRPGARGVPTNAPATFGGPGFTAPATRPPPPAPPERLVRPEPAQFGGPGFAAPATREDPEVGERATAFPVPPAPVASAPVLPATIPHTDHTPHPAAAEVLPPRSAARLLAGPGAAEVLGRPRPIAPDQRAPGPWDRLDPTGPQDRLELTGPLDPIDPDDDVLPGPDGEDTVLWTAHVPPLAEDGTVTASPALPVDVPEPRAAEAGELVTGSGLPVRRVKVILSERRNQAHPVRTVVDIQEGGAVGELLRSNLIGSQLTVALRFALLAGLTLGLLPLAFAVFPEIGRTDVLGLRLPWLLLGVLVYPFLLGLGWWHTRTAERVEQNFADHVQD